GFFAMRNAVVANLIALANSSRVQWFVIRQIAFNAWNGIRAHAAAQLTWMLNTARARLNGIRAYSQWAMNALRAHTAWAWNATRAHLAATLGAIVRNLTANWNHARAVTQRTWANIRNTIRVAWGQIQRDTFNTTQRMRVTQQNYQGFMSRSEEHTSELQSRENLVCRLLLEKK